MIVMRSADRQFSENEQHLLEAVADYASISLVNSRLFRALEERAHSLQQAAENIQANEKSRGETLEALVQELWNPLNLAGQNLSRLLEGHSGKLAADQREALSEIMDRIQLVGKVSELISTASQTPASRPGSAEVNEVLRQVADRYQPAAQQTGINLSCDFPQERIMVRGEPVLIAQVVDGLLSNSMKFCPPGSSVLLKVEKTDQHHAHILIRDNGIGISKKDLGRLFERSVQKIEPANRPPCGEGIPLVLVKHLIDTIGGNIWVESQPGQGSSFHFTLMSPR
jgi:two-component system phosphate regulon sensor histidine kinase PhoR